MPQQLPAVYLKSGKEQSLFRLHPWLFSGAIRKIKGEVKDGSLVEVYDAENQFRGTGHYQIGSIAVRMLSFDDTPIDAAFYRSSIEDAYEARLRIGLAENPHTNVFRLIHGEGDFLPGLIVDFYMGVAVVQFHSVGMFLHAEWIYQALKDVLGSRLTAIYNKSEATIPFKANTGVKDGYVFGEAQPGEVLENGNRFLVDWVAGQKTGFFIDQRENRQLLASYAKGKDVLNMFGFTGGFSVYAMQGGANRVHTVDSSKQAISLTDKNIALNFGEDERHQSFAVDAFEYLENIENQYDIIVLDPPAFAKHQDALHNALQGYKRLNAKAIRQIRKGGILFTFSCSQAVSRENFRKSVFAAAANTGRKVRIIHQLSQPADHPVNIYHPESEYLKGLVLLIEN
ncbi:MAG: class I SAM-dependent rRNA methyltransferase [Bacteroidales bacterium]|nr:class I SAM-dependent rRNA methyltransferase [Bacteroidales bacterium]